MWFPNRFNTNLPVQSQRQARTLKFRIYEEEELYHGCSKNKGTDQHCSSCKADLCFCFLPMQSVGFLMMQPHP